MLAMSRALLSLHLLGPVVVAEECAAQAAGCLDENADAASLLQHSRGASTKPAPDVRGPPASVLEAKLKAQSTAQPASASFASWLPSINFNCPIGIEMRPLEPSQTAFMVEQGKVPDGLLGWWNYPVQQDFNMLERLKADLEPVPWSAIVDPDEKVLALEHDVGWADMRSGPANEVMALMHEATHAPDVVSKVPEKLRGVFWMRGNAIAEELTVFQHGLWYEDEHVFHTTMQPFNWAWPAGKPPGVGDGVFAPGGWLYSKDASSGLKGAAALLSRRIGFSYAFEPCGPSAAYCDKQKKDDMAFAYMETNLNSNLVNATNNGVMVDEMIHSGIADGVFTLQAMSDDGSRWKRTCHWGFGGCAFIEMGSYDLLRVMDYDGKPVQPHYDDFLKHMGDVPLMVWTGWANATVKQDVAQKYADASGTGTYADAEGAATAPDLK